MKVDRIDEVIARLQGGKYLQATQQGRVFILSTVVAGLAVPISTTTAPTVVLWNPSDSKKNAILLRFTANYVSGTTVAGAIGLAYQTSMGSALGTAAPFSVFAASTPINGLIGAGAVSKMKVSAAGTNTLTAAGTWFYSMFQEYAAIATTAIAPAWLDHDFQGNLIVPPGIAVWPVGSAASGALLAQTLIWEEVDA